MDPTPEALLHEETQRIAAVFDAWADRALEYLDEDVYAPGSRAGYLKEIIEEISFKEEALTYGADAEEFYRQNRSSMLSVAGQVFPTGVDPRHPWELRETYEEMTVLDPDKKNELIDLLQQMTEPKDLTPEQRSTIFAPSSPLLTD